ncbi:MAG: type I restriction enzyme HsdR N-terminal domain-containing protein [Bacteroidales bacterium]|nr:type I restriction enzyme HsdR N-terminal domain-containing protein [Bacteroidales bacterium]
MQTIAKLNLPDYAFRITKNADNKLVILDILRKKNVLLTPEEWVRQNFLKFLIEEKKYPPSLISVESGVKINRLCRRYDAMVYNRKGNPVVLIECKAPGVKIGQETFDQVSAYNLSIKAKYIMVTNGLKHYAVVHNPEQKKFEFISEIPVFDSL